jgi:xanthine dioxygenase
MAIELAPLPLPPSADPSRFQEFGREVKGVDPGNLSPAQFKEIETLLYKVCTSRDPYRRAYLT